MGTDAISPLRQRMIEDIVIARARRFLTLIQVRGRADNPCSRSRHRDELTKESGRALLQLGRRRKLRRRSC